MGSHGLAAAMGRAVPHVEPGASLTDVLREWRPEPLALLAIALLVCLYSAGLRRRRARVRSRWLAAGGAGALVLLAATASPLEALADAVFSWHMLQHVLIVLVSAPLLVLGRVPALAATIFPGGRRAMRWLHARGRAAGAPVAVWCGFTAALWAWHIPSAYEAALRHPILHAAEHGTLLVSAVLFWEVCLVRAPGRGYGTGIAMLFTAMLQMAALSSALIFSPRPWYGPYASGLAGWPLPAAADQQVAGVVMWAAGSAVTFAALAWLVASWFRAEERSASGRSRAAGTRAVQGG